MLFFISFLFYYLLLILSLLFQEHIAGGDVAECSASSIQDDVPTHSRAPKVLALRRQCVAALGERDFQDVYAYLR
jgi:hypothetical protein